MEKSFFKEQIVKKQANGMDMLKKAVIVIVAIVLSFFSFIFLSVLAVVAVAAIWFGAWFLLQRTNKEFEYVFTNGDLDIDTIYSKSRRKRSFSANIREFETVAKVNDSNYASEMRNFQEVLDFSSGANENNTYAAMLTYNGKKTKMLFEPNEKILEAMKHYIPRKLKWKKYGQ